MSSEKTNQESSGSGPCPLCLKAGINKVFDRLGSHMKNCPNRKRINELERRQNTQQFQSALPLPSVIHLGPIHQEKDHPPPQQQPEEENLPNRKSSRLRKKKLNEKEHESAQGSSKKPKYDDSVEEYNLDDMEGVEDHLGGDPITRFDCFNNLLPAHDVLSDCGSDIEEQFGASTDAAVLHGEVPPDLPPRDQAGSIDMDTYSANLKKMSIHLGKVTDQFPTDDPDYDKKASVSNTTKSMLRLIDFFDNRPRVSRAFFDDMMSILKEEIEERNFNILDAPLRKTVVKEMKEKFGGKKPLVSREQIRRTTTTDPLDPDPLSKKPQPLTNTRKDLLDVIVFDVEKSLIDLLNDRFTMGNLNNLVVNSSNPFLPYQNTTGMGNEMLDGEQYDLALRRITENDGFNKDLEFFLPIILYCDKTGTTGNQRFALEPLVFTLAIFRKALRSNPRFWRIAGYLPDMDGKSKAEKLLSAKKNKGASVQTYHRALERILAGFKRIEKKGIIHWLRMGSQLKKVRLRPYIFCIENDGKSADMFSNRILSYNKAKKISRRCTCPQQGCDDVTKKCKGTKLQDVKESLHFAAKTRLQIMDEYWAKDETRQDFLDNGGLNITQRKNASEHSGSWSQLEDDKTKQKFLKYVEKEKSQNADRLAERGLYAVGNAFLEQDISLCYDPEGVFGVQPTDLMHALLSGMLRYLVRMSIDPLSTVEKCQLDKLVVDLVGQLNSSERDRYPRFTFATGFSRLTLITANEWPGMLMVLLIVLRTKAGEDLFQKVFDGKEKSHELENIKSKWEEAEKLQDIARDLDSKARTLLKTKKGQSDNMISSQEAGGEEDEAAELDATWPVSTEQEQRTDKKAKAVSVHDRAPKTGRNGRNDDDEEQFALRKCSIFDFIELAEALLAFHAWYKLDDKEIFQKDDQGKKNYEHDSIKENIDGSIRRLLAMVKVYMPRMNGQGWQIQKFHDILQLAYFIRKYGCPTNFEVEAGEAGLKIWAKLPAWTALCRNYQEFVKQCADRLSERFVLQKAMRELEIPSILDKNLPKWKEDGTRDLGFSYEEGVHPGATSSKCRIYLSKTDSSSNETEDGFVPPTKWLTGDDRNRKGTLALHPNLETFVRDTNGLLREENNGNVKSLKEVTGRYKGANYIDFLTEITMTLPKPNPDTRKRKHRLTFRCHPDYQSRGPWNDWVIVEYGKDGSADPVPVDMKPFYKSEYFVPAKLHLFYETNETQPDGKVEKKYYAVVHACVYRDEDTMLKKSVLTELWKLEYTKNQQTGIWVPKYRVIPVSSIRDRCLVVEEIVGSGGEFDFDIQIRQIERRLSAGDVKAAERVDLIRTKKELTNLRSRYDCVLLMKDRSSWGREFW